MPRATAVARVDFLVEGVALEFDGRVKYRAEGEDAAEVVWADKRRSVCCGVTGSTVSSAQSRPRVCA